MLVRINLSIWVLASAGTNRLGGIRELNIGLGRLGLRPRHWEIYSLFLTFQISNEASQFSLLNSQFLVLTGKISLLIITSHF